jgi:hypothetical protein
MVALSKAYTKRKTPKKCGNSNWSLSKIFIDQLISPEVSDWSPSFFYYAWRAAKKSRCG